MSDLCNVPHPEHDAVLCDKPLPCWQFHSNIEADLSWPGSPLPVKSTPTKRRLIADSAKPVEKTGPAIAGEEPRWTVENATNFLEGLRYTVLAPGVLERPHANRARSDDRSTSKAGAVHVAPRAGTQKASLLRAYAEAGFDGLTDEEAASRVGLNRANVSYWKRCGELRDGGFITETGQERDGAAGVPRIVCRINEAGSAVLANY